MYGQTDWVGLGLFYSLGGFRSTVEMYLRSCAVCCGLVSYRM